MDLTESVRPSAFSTLAATLIAPEDAFVAIREQPMWGWAIAITIAMAALGSYLGTPALRHMVEAAAAAQAAADPNIASLPPDRAAEQTRKAVAAAAMFVNYAWMFTIVVVPIVIFFEAAVLFGIRTLVRSDSTFAQLLSLSAHVQFIASGVGSVVLGVVIILHNPATYHSQADFVSSIPTAAWLVPGASVNVATFLSTLSPFSIWATVFLAFGLQVVAAFPRAVAWTSSLALLLGGAAWAGAFAR